MIKTYITILLFTICGIAFGQENEFSDSDSIIIGNKKLPKVLLIGIWHFNYPGLDAH